MSSIGPDLPPHLLAKRKRQAEEEEAATTTGAKASATPPPRSPDAAEKRRRVMGPAPPPAPLDQMPPQPAEEKDDDSSSDDEWGPSLPTSDAPATVSRVILNYLLRTNYDGQSTTRNLVTVTPNRIVTPEMRIKDYNETIG
jgi:hypothetical protein